MPAAHTQEPSLPRNECCLRSSLPRAQVCSRHTANQIGASAQQTTHLDTSPHPCLSLPRQSLTVTASPCSPQVVHPLLQQPARQPGPQPATALPWRANERERDDEYTGLAARPLRQALCWHQVVLHRLGSPGGHIVWPCLHSDGVVAASVWTACRARSVRSPRVLLVVVEAAWQPGQLCCWVAAIVLPRRSSPGSHRRRVRL